MLKSISILYRKTQMYLNEQLISLSLTSGQATFIICICENKGISQNKLAEKLEMDKSTVAKTLGKLENDGYISRLINDRDTRILNIYPTDKALETYPKLLEIGSKWVGEITKDFTDIEKKIFEQLMYKTTNNVIDYFE